MIDNTILDAILPIPDSAELKEQIINELADEGFAITNYSSGGVFNTLLMLFIQAKIELTKLLRTVLNNMFIRHASDTWMELKAADFSKTRKQPLKAQGIVTLSRSAATQAVTIPKGYVFKTPKDILGDELRYIVTKDTVIAQNVLSGTVPVEAENTGAKYNVPTGQISKSLIHLEGVDTITNGSTWLTREGSNLEDLESFRERISNSWAELATMPIADKYKSICEAVEGVLFVQVNDQHPRGQGTIDIIVTSTAGAATEALLTLVTAAANSIKAPYDNILVKSATIVTQDITLTVTVETGTNTDGMADRVTAIVTSLLKIDTSRSLNELIHADIIYAVKRDIPLAKNVKVTLPAADLVLDTDKVIVPGTITVTITEA